MSVASTALLAAGYPASIVVLTRIVPVVRERRVRWFIVHQAAVAAIVAGWAIEGRTGAVVVNATWLTAVTAWWLRGTPTRPASS